MQAAEQDRPDFSASRRAWLVQQPDLEPCHLVFIDETGASTKKVHLRDRSKRGRRCRAAVPHGHWKTTTFTTALRLDGHTAHMVLDGPMHGATFLSYVEQVLVPTLVPGDRIFMDNLPAHTVAGVKGAMWRQALLLERGVKVGIGTVWRFFDRHGVSLKKANRATVSRRAGPA